MGEQAVALAKAVGYDSAGTVEFVAGQDKSFYFLEMNTRLQVEHPVTEEVTGVDLVREMVRIAAGLPMSVPEQGIAPRGHAIELRIYAEDPAKSFMPSPGTISDMVLPEISHLRVDTGFRSGSKVTVYYDPMIAKLTAWGPDRESAIATLRDALESAQIAGVKTNIAFLQRLIERDDFLAGKIHTRYVDEQLASIMED